MVLMEAAGVSGLAASGIWGYNRKNFLYDRYMRQQQERTTIEMRLAQVDVWREDVRDIVELTEKKMDVYIIVNALQIGFCLVLYTEGRLEMQTPAWLLWHYSLALSGAFMFLLMSTWLAMHASVVAQASSVRILTQLVRPPIPSWEQIEAMRTYGTSFESINPRSMFRIPLVETAAEGFLAGPGGFAGGTPVVTSSPRGGRSSGSPSSSSHHAAKVSASASDPWGLERRGATTLPELARRPPPTQRHARLVREAARQWQSYDAFARASMTLGTILQCQAFGYYILGYVLTQDAAPWAAWAGIFIFLNMASMLLQLDVSMTLWQSRLAQTTFFSGPILTCIAAGLWSMYAKWAQQVAWILLPPAFAFHGLFLLLFLSLCHTAEQPNGALLPTSFRSVLYLDIYGWFRLGQGHAAFAGRATQAAEAGPRLPIPSLASRTPRGEAHARGSAHHEASDLHEETLLAKRLGIVHGQTFPRLGTPTASVGRRSADAVAKRSVRTLAVARPLRPEDVDLALGTRDDPDATVSAFRAAAEAERALAEESVAIRKGDWPRQQLLGVGVVGMVPNASEHTFAASSYVMQPTGLEDSGGGQGFASPSTVSCASGVEGEGDDYEIVTGRDREDAGTLPWHLFQGGATLLACLWFLGTAWATALVCKHEDINTFVLPKAVAVQETPAGAEVSMNFAMSDEGIAALPLLGTGERVLITWPSESFQPWGMSCDSTGEHFAISDEFQLYSATIDFLDGQPHLTQFRQAPRCLAVEGQALRDISVNCPSMDEQLMSGGDPTWTCRALVLYDRGRRVAACDLFDPRGLGTASANTSAGADVGRMTHHGGSALPSGVNMKATHGKGVVELGEVWNISVKWLRSPGGADHEEIISTTADAPCSVDEDGVGHGDCMVVGTNHGRMLRLRRHMSGSRELVPAAVLWNILGKTAQPEFAEIWATSLLQAIPGGLLLALRDNRRVLYAMHIAMRRVVGQWRLPDFPGKMWTSLAGGGQHIYLALQDESGRGELLRFELPDLLRASIGGGGLDGLQEEVVLPTPDGRTPRSATA